MRPPDAPLARASEPGDAFIASYVSWREARDDVRAAYARWACCSPERRALAFASYLAALEREEKAAAVYSVCTEALRT